MKIVVDGITVQVIRNYELNLNLFDENGKLVEQMRFWKGHRMEDKSDEQIARYAVNRYRSPN